jgi:ERCC4-type nuclease
MREKQMDVGDYTVSYARGDSEMILAVIERKTLNDYAASMTDGRSENITGLLRMREITGCKIYYLIEGTANPSMNKRCARKEYKCILASIRHLQIKHNISIIDAKNKRATASELFFLCEVFAGLILDGFIDVKLDDYDEIMGASQLSEEELAAKKILGSWRSLPGIGPKLALELAAKYPLKAFFDETEMELSPKLREKLAHPWSQQVQIAFLASIPGISKKASVALMNEVNIYQFFDAMEDVKAKRFGKKGISNVNRHMCSLVE